MNFTDAVTICLQKYVTFSGRAARSELWFFKLFLFTAGLVGMAIDKGVLGAGVGSSPLYSLVVLLTFLPSLSVDVRRLHDLDKSGWWWWILLIPLVGIVLYIVWLCTKGTGGPNRFGADPLAAA